MQNKKNVFLAILIGIGMIAFGMLILYFFWTGESKKYSEGKPVSCTVTEVRKIMRDTSAWGYYYDGDRRVDVKIINTVAPGVGSTYEGYVLPDAPDKVYLKTPLFVTVLMAALILLITGGGAALIIAVIAQNSADKLLAASGIETDGEVISVRRQNAGNTTYYIAKIGYTDEYGKERFFENYSDKNLRSVGERFKVVYACKKNGKYVADIK